MYTYNTLLISYFMRIPAKTYSSFSFHEQSKRTGVDFELSGIKTSNVSHVPPCSL